MKVRLATPSYSGYPAILHANSVSDLLVQNGKDGVTWHRSAAIGCPVLPRVRNVMVAEMLGSDCDGILFVDDDIGFRADDAIRIVKHGVPVVGAAAQKRVSVTTEAPRMNVAINPEGAGINEHGLMFNRLAPACFLYVAREVFETMLSNQELRDAGLVRRFIYTSASDRAAPYLATYFGYGLAPAFPGSSEYDRAAELAEKFPEIADFSEPLIDVGEDYDFCMKCEVAGIPRFIDTEIDLVHMDGRVAHTYSLRKMFQDTEAVRLEAAE